MWREYFLEKSWRFLDLLKKYILWMYTVNKNLRLFKFFHAVYLFAQLSCELYVQNWKPVLLFLLLSALTFSCLFWQILDLVVVIINTNIVIRYNLQVRQFKSNFFIASWHKLTSTIFMVRKCFSFFSLGSLKQTIVASLRSAGRLFIQN